MMNAGWIQSFCLRNDLLVVVFLGIGNHSLAAGLPVGGAHLTVHIHILEGLHQSQVLIRVSSHWQVVDRRVTHNPVFVNDVGGSVGDADISDVTEAAVVGRDGFVEVGNKRDVHRAESSFLSGLESVLHVGELGVDGDGDEFAANFSELLGLVVEGDDLGGAHEGEVEGVEEEHNILAMIGLEVNVHKVSVVPGRGNESGGRLSDQ